MELVSYHYPYIPMDINMRREILPEHNICSLYPAENYDDAFVTGNGYQQMTIKGDPYKEYIVFRRKPYMNLFGKKHLCPLTLQKFFLR